MKSIATEVQLVTYTKKKPKKVGFSTSWKLSLIPNSKSNHTVYIEDTNKLGASESRKKSMSHNKDRGDPYAETHGAFWKITKN